MFWKMTFTVPDKRCSNCYLEWVKSFYKGVILQISIFSDIRVSKVNLSLVWLIKLFLMKEKACNIDSNSEIERYGSLHKNVRWNANNHLVFISLQPFSIFWAYLLNVSVGRWHLINLKLKTERYFDPWPGTRRISTPGSESWLIYKQKRMSRYWLTEISISLLLRN